MKGTNKMDFSVSMCVYGGDNPQYFKTAVDSILNQTVKPKEVVLVVDGPVPKTLDIVIKDYEQNLIFNVIYLNTNQGHGNARRVGLEACKYELVALMDADDISILDRFEKQIKIFESDYSLSVVGGNIQEFINTKENVVGKRVVPEKNSDIKEYMKKTLPNESGNSHVQKI